MPQSSVLSTQSSRQRPRRGSVLLVVVVLLLLMAILGTSYLVTTRVDRVNSAQEVTSAQIETLVDSVRDLATGYIVNSLFVQNPTTGALEYRPANTAGYNHFDIPVYNYNNSGDSWLADRVPVALAQVPGAAAAPAVVTSTPNYPCWAAITAPMNGLGSAATKVNGAPLNPAFAGVPVFEDPVTGSQWNPYVQNPPLAAGALNPQLPVFPTFVNGFPALAVGNQGTGGSPLSPYVAGDADGDGIADCGLIRLPGVYSDGLTYYAGIRIIDNNSAINVNTANDNTTDGTTNTAPPPYVNGTTSNSFDYGFFPENVGLTELLSAGVTEVPRLAAYQQGNITPTLASVYPDNGSSTAITGAAWGSTADMLASQLAHRIGNSGYVAPGVRAQPIPLGDQVDLAYRGGLFANPRTFSVVGTNTYYPQSVLETLLPTSVFGAAYNVSGNSIYTTTFNSASTWFNNFNYTSVATILPVPNPRPLLVVRNPVSNAIPVPDPDVPNLSVANPAMLPYGNLGRWQANVNYQPGDIVYYQGVIYYCTTANLSQTATPPPATNWNAVQVFPNGQPYIAGAVVARAVGGPTSTYPSYPGAAYTVSPSNSEVRYYVSTLSSSNASDPLTAGNTSWRLVTGTPTKTCVNTADFPELFRAYWCAMAGGGDPHGTPLGDETESLTDRFSAAYPSSFFGNGIYTGNTFSQPISAEGGLASPGGFISANSFASKTPYHRARMFRSSLRDPRTAAAEPFGLIFPPSQELQLRAALAAVNTLNLRTHSQNQATIQLTAVLNGIPQAVNVAVYGVQQQPYISEVYCNTEDDGSPSNANTLPYIAIKLCNPYGSSINLQNWQLGYISRQPTTNYASGAGLNFVLLHIFGATDIINGASGGSNGYLLIDNFGTGAGGTVSYRPGETGLLPATGPTISGTNLTYIKIPGLDSVLSVGHGNELVLLAPPNSSASAPYGYIPIDSYDFTGIHVSRVISYAWHYARGDAFREWQSTQTGRYDGTQSSPLAPRQQGTQVADWTPGTQTDPWDPNAGTPVGNPPRDSSGDPFTMNSPTAQATFPAGTTAAAIRSLQVAPDNSPSIPSMAAFPYGGFARDGDILTVPYFGAYTVYNGSLAAGNIWEMNSAPIDAAFADDSVGPDDPSPLDNDATVQPGRFCPTQRDLFTASGTAALGGSGSSPTLTDSSTGSLIANPPAGSLPSSSGGALFDHASWADWDVVISGINGYPQSEIRHVKTWTSGVLNLDAPPTDINGNAVLTGNVNYFVCRPYSWTTHVLDYLTVHSPQNDYLPDLDPNNTTVKPQPVANENAGVSPSNSSLEDTVGVDGLVNINTAPIPVLAALPLVLTSTGTVDTTNTNNLVNLIVQDRQRYGPFKTIFDLNRVVDSTGALGFQSAYGTIAPTADSTTGLLGNMNPIAASPMSDQFNELNLQATRLSNLVTTRSDTFTVYIVVEGWQNAGTATAQLVVTRRSAFIVDRNTVTPTSRVVRTVTVPNN